MRQLEQLQIVAFDLDDTLFPEHQFVRSGFAAVAEYLEKSHGVSGFFKISWMLFQAGERGSIFNHALKQLGFDLKTEKQVVGELVEQYRRHRPEIGLFEDAKWALKCYSDKFPLVLISDGYLRTQQNKAESLQIEDYFKGFYFTDQWGRACWKPSSCAFEKVEADFSVNGKQCLYISDNPAKDFVSPNQLGWESVWINRVGGEYSEVEIADGGAAKQRIESLYQLEEIIG